MPSVGVLVPGLLAAAVASAQIDLSGPWRFQVGDDLQWAAPDLDDSSWDLVSVPTGWGRTSPRGSFAWYRRSVTVDPEHAYRPPGLSVLIGKVDSAYELYAGGRLLGTVGSLPPDPRLDYDRHRTYVLPPEAIEADGRVVLALRVWKSPETESAVGGPVEGRFLVASSVDLERRLLLDEMLQLFLGGLFVLVGLYHLHLSRRRTNLVEYFWYALVAIDAGLYTLLRTQWKYALSDDFVAFKEIEYLVLLVLPALFVQFVWPLLGLPIPRLLRVQQLASVVLGVVVALTPGLWLNTHSLPIWELSLVPLVLVTFIVLGRETRRRNPEARTIVLGLSLFMLFATNDIAVDRGLVTTPRLTAFGFATLVLSMAISLANRFSRAHAELATFGRELELRVEARTRDLRQRTEEAAAANRAKSQFLATMSHELRTPLNAVIGMTGLVLNSPLTGEQRESLEVVRRSGGSLLALVDDILDFSRLEAGRVELEARRFSLRGCIEESLDLLAARADEKGLDLAACVDPRVPHLMVGDAARVRRVLVSLVDNATKFTPAGGVLVEASAVPGADGRVEVQVSVTDTGIGIPADRRDQLFEAFSQVDASHARAYGGTGLGLAISRRLCELMGGRLWLEDSTGPGSLFRFTFAAEAVEGEPPKELRASQPYLEGKVALLVGARPFTRRMIESHLHAWKMSVQVTDDPGGLEGTPSGEADVAIVGVVAEDEPGAGERWLGRYPGSAIPCICFGPLGSRPKTVGAAGRGITAHLVTPLQGPALHRALLRALGAPLVDTGPSEAPADASGPRPLRILVADDSIVNQKVALRMLARLGYRADFAGNGREVLEALGQRAYDVVFLDVQMPEMDGLETARRIRAEGGKGPRLIAMTANALPGDREVCLAAGMDDYLSKPVSLEALAAALHRGMPDDDLPVLSAEVLSRLQVLEDASNPTLVADVLNEFLAEAPVRLAGLEAALLEEDGKNLGFLAHTLKGSAGMIGAAQLQASCAALEEASARGEAARFGQLVATIRSDLAVLGERIAAHLPPAGPSGPSAA